MLLLFILTESSWGSPHRLEIKVEELKSMEGNILYILFKGKVGFPDDPSKGIQQGKIATIKAKTGLELIGLEAGEYALSLIHDENDNGKLDTNFLGIPEEGVGFSKNPRIFFGAPSYEKCKFEYKDGLKIKIKIKMKHFK